jgi:hypothetical protein
MRLLIFTVLLISFSADRPGNVRPALFPYIQAQVDLNALIQSPSEGDLVQGNVTIRGNATGDGFQSYEIDFGNTADPGNTWYMIQADTEPVMDGTLAVWNTVMISDGDYTIRLLVTYASGTTDEVITHVRVRNYLPVNTEAPLPALPSTLGVDAFAYPTDNRITTLITPTPLPENPAQVSEAQVLGSMGKGASIVLVAFAFLGIYIGLHALVNKRN